jgi:hypothetical protein
MTVYNVKDTVRFREAVGFLHYTAISSPPTLLPSGTKNYSDWELQLVTRLRLVTSLSIRTVVCIHRYEAKFSLGEVTKAQRANRGTALLFL